MIQPISLKEYMDIIARKYQSLHEGEEKDELLKEIKRIAERVYPAVKIDEISNSGGDYNLK